PRRSCPCRSSRTCGGRHLRRRGRASCCDRASVPWCSLERNVVVGGTGLEVRVGLGAGGDELVAAALAGVAPAEELDVLGDDLDRLPLAAVLRVPLAPLEASVDPDGPALREELGAAFGLPAPDGHVEVVGLVGPLPGLVLTPRVYGETQAAHGRAARRVPELGVARQVPDEHDAVDVGHGLPLS